METMKKLNRIIELASDTLIIQGLHYSSLLSLRNELSGTIERLDDYRSRDWDEERKTKYVNSALSRITEIENRSNELIDDLLKDRNVKL